MDFSEEDKEEIRPLAEREANKLLQKENFRQRTIQIISEFTRQVGFMRLVRKYAADEMDARMFRSFKYWAVIIFTAFLTSAIGFFMAKILN